ncbi:MAG: hypothetical protein ACRENA_07915 [Vulcanimicrobiaceae bacterium]
MQAIPLLFRNPALILAPLFTAVLGIVVQLFAAPSGGGFLGSINGSIMGLLIFLFDAFGLAISVIIAEAVWRRGKGSFDDGWEEGRRKAGDIFMAAIGLSFIMSIAQMIGGFLNSTIASIVLMLLTIFFFIYTIPAAAIGGIPGFNSLNTSIERVKENYLSALALMVTFVVIYAGPLFLGTYLWAFGDIAHFLIVAVLQAIGLAYFALVLARSYDQAAFIRRRF